MDEIRFLLQQTRHHADGPMATEWDLISGRGQELEMNNYPVCGAASEEKHRFRHISFSCNLHSLLVRQGLGASNANTRIPAECRVRERIYVMNHEVSFNLPWYFSWRRPRRRRRALFQ